jgi:hypothetical protein
MGFSSMQSNLVSDSIFDWRVDSTEQAVLTPPELNRHKQEYQKVEQQQLVVPEDMSAGQIMTMRTKRGQRLNVLIPEGLTPGAVFVVNLGNKPHVLRVDCGGARGSSCLFNFRRQHYNLDEALTGHVSIRNLTKPLLSAEIIIMKVEAVDGETTEKVERKVSLLGKDRCTNTEVVRQTILDGNPKALEFDVKIPLAECTGLGPTCIDFNARVLRTEADEEDPLYDEDAFTLRYFVRFQLTTATGACFFNTAEIVLFRKAASAASTGA